MVVALEKQGQFVSSCTKTTEENTPRVNTPLRWSPKSRLATSNTFQHHGCNCIYQSKKQLKYKLVPIPHFGLILYYHPIPYSPPPPLTVRWGLFKHNNREWRVPCLEPSAPTGTTQEAPCQETNQLSTSNCQKHWADGPHPHPSACKFTRPAKNLPS